MIYAILHGDRDDPFLSLYDNEEEADRGYEYLKALYEKRGLGEFVIRVNRISHIYKEE